MADGTVLNPGAGGDTIATDDAGAGGKVQIIKLAISADGSATVIPADATNGLRVDPAPVAVADGGALPAKGVQVGGTDGSVFQVLSTDSAGRLNTNINGTVPVSGGLTDAQLRASAVPVDTELPAAAALADAAANPTSPGVGAFGMLWNGATWDRARGDATNGLTTNLKALNGTAVDVNSGTKSAGTQRVILASDQTVVPVSDNAGSLTVDAPVGTPVFVRLSDGSAAIATLPVSLASLPSLAAGTNNIGDVDVLTLPNVTNGGTFAVQDSEKIADDAAFTVASTKLMPVGFLADQTSTDSVNEGDIGAARITLDRIQIVTQAPSADTAGLTTFHLVSAATTNATVVKASAGKLHRWYIYNSNAAARKLAFHNAASAPTAGASIFFTMVIPPTSAANDSDEIGIAFSTGIAITTVTGLADNDSVAVAANDLIINLWFI